MTRRGWPEPRAVRGSGPWRVRAVAACAGLLLATAAGAGQTQSSAVTASAIIDGLAKLSLSATTLTFPDADPDTSPLISSSSGPLAITAKTRSAATLTVEASDDLRSGSQIIPASALTWSGSGSGFVDGTMSTSSAQPVGSWTGPGVRSGTQSYLLANAWTYATGTYTMTVTYTLTAP